MSDLLLVERRDHIVTLTMNRPEKHNSINPEMAKEIGDTLNSLEEDSGVRVVVIRGAGQGAFSSGFDIGRIQSSSAARGGEAMVHYAMDSVIHFPFPVIAMISGICMGGGAGLAICCDLRVAAENARFAIPPAKLGLVYHYEGLLRAINLVGVGFTKEIFLIGRAFPASRAREMGLVNFVVPQAELEPFTYDLAGEIARNAPLSVSGMKAAINHLLHFQRTPEEDKEAIKAIMGRAAQSEDLQEGRKAFLEKRAPQFKGR